MCDVHELNAVVARPSLDVNAGSGGLFKQALHHEEVEPSEKR